MVRFVVMAAGQATRMGRDKLALPCKQTTVLGYVLQTVFEGIQLQIQCSRELTPFPDSVEIYVVARHAMENYLTCDTCQTFREMGGTWLQVPRAIPLSETLRIGLSNFKDEIQMVGFLPGDQVGVTSESLAGCFIQVLKQVPDFLVPTSREKVGSPVFFHRRYVPELRELHGEQGGRNVLYRYPERWTRYNVEEETFLQDVDTPEEYQLWIEHTERMERSSIKLEE